MNTSSEGPRSIQRLLGLFTALADAPDGLTLAQISVTLSSPKSSLLILLRPLVEQTYLIHKDRHYFAGPQMYHFASAILTNYKFGSMIRHYMEELVATTSETVLYATLDETNDNIVYTDVIESPKAVRYVTPVGVMRPLYCTAAGQLFLAYKDAAWQQAYIDRTDLSPRTATTIVDGGKLLARLTKIRKSGYSFSIGEAVEEAAGVAAPVFDADGTVAGALVLGGPSDRAVRNREKMITATTELAKRASRAAGYRG
ncbi:MAG: IclR family transcriptional regulator [Marinosulfonomonas sp.]|nr:IclR family transcriptional regulator [Marinosulfonomonas sp.]